MIANVLLPSGLTPQHFEPFAVSVCEFFGQDEVMFSFIYSGNNGILHFDLAAEFAGRTVCCCVCVPHPSAAPVIRKGLHAVHMVRREPCNDIHFIATVVPQPDLRIF